MRARVMALVVMTLPVGLLGAALSLPGESADLLIPGLMCLAGCTAVATFTGLAKWSVDNDGFQRFTPLLPHVAVRWDDVAWVQVESLGRLTIRYGTGKATLQVPAGLTGVESFLRLLLDRSPPSAFGDVTRRILEERAGTPPPATWITVDAPEPVCQERAGGVARWRVNPFFALGLTPECSRADVERSGQKLLALLAIGSAGAKRFVTPVGEMERTADSVRAAMAELRDPEKRIGHETWARLASLPDDEAVAPKGEDPARPWPEAMRAIRWSGP